MTTPTTQDRQDAERPAFYEIVIGDKYVMRFYANKMIDNTWRISYEEFEEFARAIERAHGIGE